MWKVADWNLWTRMCGSGGWGGVPRQTGVKYFWDLSSNNFRSSYRLILWLMFPRRFVIWILRKLVAWSQNWFRTLNPSKSAPSYPRRLATSSSLIQRLRRSLWEQNGVSMKVVQKYRWQTFLLFIFYSECFCFSHSEELRLILLLIHHPTLSFQVQPSDLSLQTTKLHVCKMNSDD